MEVHGNVWDESNQYALKLAQDPGKIMITLLSLLRKQILPVHNTKVSYEFFANIKLLKLTVHMIEGLILAASLVSYLYSSNVLESSS